MKPQTEHQSHGFSALGEAQPNGAKYQWLPEGDGFTLYRIGRGARQSCGRLNTGASMSTHELATLYNSAPTLLRQRDELLVSLKMALESGQLGPLMPNVIRTMRTAIINVEDANTPWLGKALKDAKQSFSERPAWAKDGQDRAALANCEKENQP